MDRLAQGKGSVGPTRPPILALKKRTIGRSSLYVCVRDGERQRTRACVTEVCGAGGLFSRLSGREATSPSHDVREPCASSSAWAFCDCSSTFCDCSSAESG
ncbi:unnamed protein product [Leptosia nina]|uniref:Uncharacterized protein n=1 Tax=Leptosia nina TaxID=320188 RepID=A0AAV1K4R5_9NEOP